MSRNPRVAGALAALCALFVPAGAQVVQRAALTALRNVRLAPDPAAVRQTLVLRDGRIDALLPADAPIPAGAVQIDGRGSYALPAFIDAFSQAGWAPKLVDKDKDLPPDESADVLADMRLANRKGLRPGEHAAELAKLSKEQRSIWRRAGFGAIHVAPAGQILAGQSALLTTREAATRDAVLAADVFLQGAWEAEGPGYPGTRMGYVAQLRQFVLDARHYALLRQRWEQGRPGPRPPWDPELEAAQAFAAGRQTLLAQAERANDIHRWLAIARELGFPIAFAGGREAYRHAQLLADAHVPVVLTLAWPEEVEAPKTPESAASQPAASEPVDEYRAPLELQLERRRLWEEQRDGALVLAKAGVPLAFGTGRAQPNELLQRTRKLLQSGFDRELLRAALTERAAELLGVGRHLGKLAPGWDATFCLWSADPLDASAKDARLRWIFVDGFGEEYELKAGDGLDGPPAQGVDLSGEWKLHLAFEGAAPLEAEAQLEMALDGSLSGTIVFQEPPEGTLRYSVASGKVGGTRARLEGKLALGGQDVKYTLELKLVGEAHAKLEGKAEWKLASGEQKPVVTGERVPKYEEDSLR